MDAEHNTHGALARRSVVAAALGGSAAVLLGSGPTTALPQPRSAPALVRRRLTLPYGVQTGDPGVDDVVLWARTSGPGRLYTRVGGRVLQGPWATEASDFTARLNLQGLRGGEHEAQLWFADERGNRGEQATASFRLPGHKPQKGHGKGSGKGSHRDDAQSFVWTGDTAGQGWGINPDLGGMTAYATMHSMRPDFFIHAGDTVYSDGPISERVTEPDGQVWRNVVTEGVEKVAESLDEFRGRHRYNLTDHNVRAFYADVPVIAQWDDHETHNNWYPGQRLDVDDRYTEKSIDVLARRARQAWQEYQPIRADHVRGRGRSGFAEQRIYRKIRRGRHLDVFCLDMRSFKGANTPGKEPQATPIFGAEQVRWLLREVRRSRATWKVISADLPLGLIVPDTTEGKPNQESIANADPGNPLGRELELATVLRGLRGVPNVVWLTADVHYCAAHHYSPERAAFTDFDPFWEFVAGPISAGGFGPNKLDDTFGPKAVFVRAADYVNQSPRAGNQFFGHVDIADDGAFTVSLRNTANTVLWQHTLQPRRG